MAKRATSLTLDCEMLDEAKAFGLNVSRAAQEGIAAALKAERTRRWKEENAEAIRQYNKSVEQDGVLLAEHRMFP